MLKFAYGKLAYQQGLFYLDASNKLPLVYIMTCIFCLEYAAIATIDLLAGVLI